MDASRLLHFRSDLHLSRKAFHMGMGLLVLFVYLKAGLTRAQGLSILGFFFVLTFTVETLRLYNAKFNETFIKVWGPLLRSCETNRYSGTPYYIASMMIAIAIFPKPVAVIAIAFLAIGDPVASFFGILYGKKSIRFSNGKSLIGTMAGVFACIATALVALRLLEPLFTLSLTFEHWLILSIVGGVAGGFAELLPLEVDDNFSIPVVSGFALWVLFVVMGVVTH